MVPKLLMVVMLAGLFTLMFVMPVHVYLTGEALKAKVLDCKITSIPENETQYEIITDFNQEPYLSSRCNRKKCTDVEPGVPTWLEQVLGSTKGPSCGDYVTVLRSKVSGRYLMFEGEPSIYKAWFASTSGTLTLVALVGLATAIGIAWEILRGFAVFLRGEIVGEFRGQVSANSGKFAAMPIAVFATGTSTLLLLSIIMVVLTCTFVACRMILLSSLPSRFIVFTAVTSVVTLLLAGNAPRLLAEWIFNLHQHRIIKIVRDLAAIVIAIRVIYFTVVAQGNAPGATILQLAVAVANLTFGINLPDSQ